MFKMTLSGWFLLLGSILVGWQSFAATPIQFLEFPAGSKAGDTLSLTSPIETNLPCNGSVRVSIGNFSTQPVASSYKIAANPVIPNQTLGAYNWTTNGNNFSFYNTTQTTLKYRVTFTFANAPDPSKLILIVSALAQNTKVTVSAPVTKVAEYSTPSAQLWCTTSCPNGTAPILVDGTKKVLTSGYNPTSGTDDRNTGFGFFQTSGTFTTLTLDFEQQNGDGLGWTLAYACSPCACQGAPKPDPDFQLSATLNISNTSTTQVVATSAPLPAGAKFSWTVQEIDASGNVIGPVANNPSAWWPNSAYNDFSGYTFQQKRRYRITRGVWSDCYTFTTISKVLYLCSNCTN